MCLCWPISVSVCLSLSLSLSLCLAAAGVGCGRTRRREQRFCCASIRKQFAPLAALVARRMRAQCAFVEECVCQHEGTDSESALQWARTRSAHFRHPNEPCNIASRLAQQATCVCLGLPVRLSQMSLELASHTCCQSYSIC